MDRVAYSWNALEDDHIIRCLFEFDDRTDQQQMADLFQATLCRCVWEHSYQRPHTDANEEVMAAFCEYVPRIFCRSTHFDSSVAKKSVPSTPQRGTATQAPSTPTKVTFPTTPQQPPKASPAVTPAPQTPSSFVPESPVPPLPAQEVDGAEVMQVKADLFLFDESKATFFLYDAIVNASIHNIEKSKDAILCTYSFETQGIQLLTKAFKRSTLYNKRRQGTRLSANQ